MPLVRLNLRVFKVPGYMASPLEARLEKPNTRAFWCQRYGERVRLWFDVRHMLPFAFDCFEENMQLIYNKDSRSTRNNEGVYIRPVGFGSARALRYVADGIPLAASECSSFVGATLITLSP